MKEMEKMTKLVDLQKRQIWIDDKDEKKKMTLLGGSEEW